MLESFWIPLLGSLFVFRFAVFGFAFGSEPEREHEPRTQNWEPGTTGSYT